MSWMTKAMKHPDKVGAGADKRRGLSPEHKKKVVSAEWGRGTLHMGGSGKIVPKNRPDIMWAIANSEARRAARGR